MSDGSKRMRRDVPPRSETPETPEEPDQPDQPVCDLCGGAMIDRHCKLVCRACGYQRDCSDP